MFEKGEYIIYGTTGVCEVMDITTISLDGIPSEKLYYILRPCYKSGSKVFTPVDNQTTPMRKILNRIEASALIDDIPNIQELWVGNDKQREDQYKQAIKSCECIEWIRIIKALYQRSRERIAQGKKITATDERYLRLAQDNLYSELSIPLEIPKEQMDNYINSRFSFAESGSI